MINSISGFRQFDISSISQMRQNFFNKLDSNSDDSVDKTEFATALQEMESVDIDKVFSKLDTNSDNTISTDELNTAMDKIDESISKNSPPPPPPMGMMGGNSQISASTNEEKNAEIFSSLDTNNDGNISKPELETYLEEMQSENSSSNLALNDLTTLKQDLFSKLIGSLVSNSGNSSTSSFQDSLSFYA